MILLMLQGYWDENSTPTTPTPSRNARITKSAIAIFDQCELECKSHNFRKTGVFCLGNMEEDITSK